ncbi:uncharacterized protein LOC121251862 [Juglans microcarpa x Juglans regia]|uniref:uncharacterized protein LOC121251862 n=1 Tax=Juglans microcarpa x Juglans regia TaxID=2249226 RepID=UPI001B7E9D0A|nr:uncharacterized protein LOC121251862 [Juglans microcarpa x Juglans regia]
MVRHFSRNTKLVNHSDEPLEVAVTVDGRFHDMSLIIQPGEHGYMCYADLGIEHNGGRSVTVNFYIGEQPTRSILTSKIRDHEKIIFFIRDDGTIAHDLIKGSMIKMNGMVISMKGAVKKIKSLLM